MVDLLPMDWGIDAAPATKVGKAQRSKRTNAKMVVNLSVARKMISDARGVSGLNCEMSTAYMMRELTPSASVINNKSFRIGVFRSRARCIAIIGLGTPSSGGHT